MTYMTTLGPRQLRPHRLAWTVALALSLALTLAAACGGGDKEADSAARNPTDPRRVPTATLPAQRPTAIAAIDGGQGAGRPALPDSYVVKAGDTLGSIATDLGITTDELSRANPNIDPRGLRIGQELRVPRVTPTPSGSGQRGSPSPTPPGGSPAASPTGARTATPAASPGTSATPSGARTATPPASASASPRPSGASPSPAGSPGTYTVQSGDTGCALARRFGVSLQQLAQANGISVDALANLSVGQSLRIPASTGADPGC
jgi:LysM repeat protein